MKKKNLKKILIVDDDPSIRTLLEVNLKNKNYKIITASSGAEALSKARTEKPNLIILDLMMPDIDGYHVCAQITFEENIVPPPKILVLTARKEEVDKGFAKKIGADDYLTKPFIFEELLKKVNNLLQ